METQAAEERQRTEEERLVEEKTRKRTESIASGMDKDNQPHQQSQQLQQEQSSNETGTTTTTLEIDAVAVTSAPDVDADQSAVGGAPASAESSYHLINEAAAQVVEDLIRRVAIDLDGVDETLETLTLTDDNSSLAATAAAMDGDAEVNGADGGAAGDRLSSAPSEDTDDANWTAMASAPPANDAGIKPAGAESSGTRTPTGSLATQDAGKIAFLIGILFQ